MCLESLRMQTHLYHPTRRTLKALETLIDRSGIILRNDEIEPLVQDLGLRVVPTPPATEANWDTTVSDTGLPFDAVGMFTDPILFSLDDLDTLGRVFHTGQENMGDDRSAALF